jgi:hypothetical protein
MACGPSQRKANKLYFGQEFLLISLVDTPELSLWGAFSTEIPYQSHPILNPVDVE